MLIQTKIEKEMISYKKGLLNESKETIIQFAYKISTYDTGEAYLVNYIPFLSYEERKILENTDDVLFLLYDYVSSLESGEIDEDMIKEFLAYLIENTDEKKNNENISTDLEYITEQTYKYHELSDTVKKEVFEEALSYIEAEFKNNEDILKDKLIHAKSEAEECAMYYKNGTIAYLI